MAALQSFSLGACSMKPVFSRCQYTESTWRSNLVALSCFVGMLFGGLMGGWDDCRSFPTVMLLWFYFSTFLPKQITLPWRIPTGGTCVSACSLLHNMDLGGSTWGVFWREKPMGVKWCLRDWGGFTSHLNDKKVFFTSPETKKNHVERSWFESSVKRKRLWCNPLVDAACALWF